MSRMLTSCLRVFLRLVLWFLAFFHRTSFVFLLLPALFFSCVPPLLRSPRFLLSFPPCLPLRPNFVGLTAKRVFCFMPTDWGPHCCARSTFAVRCSLSVSHARFLFTCRWLVGSLSREREREHRGESQAEKHFDSPAQLFVLFCRETLAAFCLTFPHTVFAFFLFAPYFPLL